MLNLFRLQVRRACQLIADKPPKHRLVLTKSWNEWAEENYLEPDRENGIAYIQALAVGILPGFGDGGGDVSDGYHHPDRQLQCGL
jgi:hypothetical protein